ncbi:MAG: flagellar biosynthesis anti-sigma factor FlgM [Vampirovibrio sp.]|nr:flagellar biosynthesis anti-sigma factor FlgM [Vampirovibrio sp.]
MVESISGKDSRILQDAATLAGQTPLQQVERLNQESARGGSAGPGSILDGVEISDAARAKLESEKVLLKFSRLAQRVQEQSDTDRVSQLKQMVDSGRINEYLRNVNTDELAGKILESPTGAFLR